LLAVKRWLKKWNRQLVWKRMASTLIGSVFIVSGLLEIIIPLIIGFYLTRRFGTSWKTWFVGALMFIVSLIRIPLNTYVSQLVLGTAITPLTYSLLVLIPSLTAGIFEEAARYVGFRYLIKDDTYEKGLMYGAGHGGIESILLVGVSVLSVGVILFTSPEVLPPGQLEAILATPAYLPLVGLYERIMTMIIHIGLSIMVLESVRRKGIKYFLAAIGTHTLLNYMAVSVAGYGVVISELLITVFAVGVGYWAYNRLRDEGIIG
jgi:uncharacterized membrane protein YhfC